jgi:hypothetical protein
MTTTEINARLSQAAIAYDRRQSLTRFHNPSGLRLTLERIDLVMGDIKAGATPRQALLAGFNDRLLDRMLTAIGEPKFTLEEKRAGSICYQPAAAEKD